MDLLIGGCFAVAMFFSPLFLSIPSAATAPALIIVGLLMAEQIRHVNFDDLSESIPAFICMITYVLMNMICGKFKKKKYTKS